MSWIKRNLLLVVSGVVTLGLLGFGGYYLYSAIQSNNSTDEEITGIKEKIKSQILKDPTPNQENVNAAKAEANRLAQYILDAKKLFPATPLPAEPLNPLSFKTLLRTTVAELRKEADGAGIKIAEPDYTFTFRSQWDATIFAPDSLRPLSERLSEVKFIAEVLFKSRINRLVGMRRAVVAGERVLGAGQPGGTGDYLGIPARTNAETGMMLWPYEVTFECFQSELASVLDGLQAAQYGFVVKSPVIEPVELPGANAPGRFPPGAQPPPGRGPRVGPAAAAAAAAAAANASGLITIVNEKPLRVTLRIEVIKPETFGGRGGPGGGGPGGGGGGGRGGRGGPGGGGGAPPAGAPPGGAPPTGGPAPRGGNP